jgi:OOP family OmpA-OmpF porin
MGVGAGQTTLNVDDVLGSNYTFDENDTGYKIFAGYRFFPWLAVEGAYLDSGSPEVDFNYTDGSRETLNIAVESVVGAAVFSLPINEKFELFVKPGMAYWMADTRYRLWGPPSQPPAVIAIDQDDSGAAFFIGAGAGFQHGNAGLRIEYEWYKAAPEYDDVSDEFVTEVDADAGFLSLSIIYMF